MRTALLSNPAESDIRPDQVGVAPIPVSEGNQSYSTLGGWNFFINASTDKQDEAWEFIKFMTAPEQMKFNALEGGKLPPGGASTTIRRFWRICRSPASARRRSSPTPHRGRSLRTTRTCRWSSPDMSLELAKQFNAALAGEVSPEQAVKTLQSDLRSIIEEGQAVG